MINLLLVILFIGNSYASSSIWSEEWFQPFRSDFSQLKERKNPFARCNDQYGHPIKVRNEFLTDCFPEVIYSWGSIDKANEIIQSLKKFKVWNQLFTDILGRNALYFSLTPVSTIFYGNIPIRVKLKQGIKYKHRKGFDSHSNPCDAKNAKFSDFKNTVFVYSKMTWPPYGVTYEVILCSADVIHSISLLEEKHFDEVLNDLYLQTELKSGYSYIQNEMDGNIIKVLDINIEGRPFLQRVVTEKKCWYCQYSSRLVPFDHQMLDGQKITEEVVYENIRLFWMNVIEGNKNIILINPSEGNKDSETHFDMKEPLVFH